jgi:putative sigma-54 modulation protein
MSRKSKTAELEQTYDITITGRHVLVTEAMKNYALEKIAKIERFSHRIIDVNVTMDIQKLEQRVDILCLVDNIKIKASASSEDMYASIDKAVDKMAEQIRRHKTRVQDHHSITHEDIAMNVNIYEPLTDEELIDGSDDFDQPEDSQLLDKYRIHNIVSVESKPLKTLTHHEAILKMHLSEFKSEKNSFMLFRSEEDQKIKVIYRRPDGNYGIIEPEK